jgi:hypothetical protein
MDIYQLQAPADGEHWNSAAKCLGKEVALHLIAQIVGRLSLGAALLAVSCRIYIGAAGEQ